MSMFSRISDIVQANINAMLDKAEDPVKVIRLIIQEMEEALVELRSVAAKNLADKKQLERQIEQQQLLINHWQQKAELALEKEREDLARSALMEKHQVQLKADSVAQELKFVEENVVKLQEDAARLNEKLAEAKAKQNSLVSRQQSASVRLKAKAKQHDMKIDETIARFEHYERRIDDLEAQVEAYDVVESEQSLAAQFKQLEQDDSIDKALAELKQKVA